MPASRKLSSAGSADPLTAFVIHQATRPSASMPERKADIGLDHRAWNAVAAHPGTVKAMLTRFGEALQRSEDRGAGVRMTIVIDPAGSNPRVEIDDIPRQGLPTAPDDLDAAMSDAMARGAQRAAAILAGPDMLSADAFAQLIGVSREAVRLKRRRHDALGLEGAKRGVRFPRWQVTDDGGLLPALPQLFTVLGGNSWTVYRFLIQHHPELDGASAVDALKAGRVAEVLAAAENVGRAFS